MDALRTAPPATPTLDQPPAVTAVPGLGAELRQSLLLLGGAVGVTVGMTTVATAALRVLS